MTTHPQRTDYPYLHPITTRWHDNDIYGHINNVTYYAYFDSAVNSYLIAEGGLDIHQGEQVAFVVSSGCDYFAPIAFPDAIEVGVRDRKSTRLNSSHVKSSYAVFCLKKQNVSHI